MLSRIMKSVDQNVAALLEASLSGKELSVDEAETLLTVEGADFHALCWAADEARREDVGEDVTYVVCRNLNFTNICYVGCSFCGFARHKHQADAYRRLRNTFRYLLGNLHEFDESECVEVADMPELERFILHRLAELDQLVRNCCERYDFHAMFT